MYQVKNKTKEPRQIWNNGKFIIVGPEEFILTSKPVENTEIWEVKLFEEQNEQINKTKIKKLKNGSVK